MLRHLMCERLLKGPMVWPGWGYAQRKTSLRGLWTFATMPELENAHSQALSRLLVLMVQLYPMLTLGFRVRSEGWLAHALLSACEQPSELAGLRRLYVQTSEPLSVPEALSGEDEPLASGQLQLVLEPVEEGRVLPAQLELVEQVGGQGAWEARWMRLLRARVGGDVKARGSVRGGQSVSGSGRESTVWWRGWREEAEGLASLMEQLPVQPLWDVERLAQAADGTELYPKQGSGDTSIQMPKVSNEQRPLCRLEVSVSGEVRGVEGWQTLLVEEQAGFSLRLCTQETRLPNQCLHTHIKPLMGEDSRAKYVELLLKALSDSREGLFALNREHKISIGNRLLEKLLAKEVDEGVMCGLNTELLTALELKEAARYLHQRTQVGLRWHEGRVHVMLALNGLDTRSLADTVTWIESGIQALRKAAEQLESLLRGMSAGAGLFRGRLARRLEELLPMVSPLRAMLKAGLRAEEMCEWKVERCVLLSQAGVLSGADKKREGTGFRVLRMTPEQVEVLLDGLDEVP
ncbi:MAG: hypothetical protein ACKO6N_02580, partial [Myxococcota bacterium]